MANVVLMGMMMNLQSIDRWFPFPLDGSPFRLPLGIQVLKDHEPILIETESRDHELHQKSGVDWSALGNYFGAEEDSLVSQVELCHYLQSRHAERGLVMDQRDPLLSIAMQVQEDLVLLRGDWPHRVVAGAVFFPSGWSIADKLGQSLQAIHRVVPGFQQSLEPQTDRLMSHLKVDRPVWRMNWGVRPTQQLDQSPRWAGLIERAAAAITDQNAANACYFRVERQTLSRLPTSGDILFTIHTRQWPIASLGLLQRKYLYQTLATCPDETLAYKGIERFYRPLMRSLENGLQQTD